MKKIIIFYSIFFSICFLSLFGYAIPDRERLLNDYRQNQEIERKIKAIHALAKMRDEGALKIFIDDLCNPSQSDDAVATRSGIFDKVRERIAISLREYAVFSIDKLIDKFNSLRRVIENDRINVIAAESALTASIWIKKWDESYKKLFVNSIMKRLKKTSAWNTMLGLKFTEALKIIKSEQAIVALSYMLRMGFVTRVNNEIRKVLSSYQDGTMSR